MKLFSLLYRAAFLLILTSVCLYSQTISFNSSGLVGELSENPTSLQFGPDGRLYVAQQDGLIYAYSIERVSANNYSVTSVETIDIVRNETPNHDDDGAYNNTKNRQVTGLYLTGSSTNPVLYVSSSDWRIGAGGGGNDLNLDTNSGILHRLTRNGNSWEKVDLVRGLPRSEENHSVNGMAIDPLYPNILYLAVGGNTNAGSPSNNFAFHTEYAYSAAILSIDLSVIDNMPVQSSLEYGYSYSWVYDLPTLDDPTRTNEQATDGYTDNNDPFGGNDGLNQAKIDPSSPVQIHSPGWRNVYDLVITSSPGRESRMYAVDNGANGGWGGHPEGEADYPGETKTALVTNNYVSGEPGSTGIGPGGDPSVNNKNGLHYIRPLVSGELNYVSDDPFNNQIYYAGHPTPIRGNPAGSGLYTKGSHTLNPDDGTDAYWRNEILLESDPNFSSQSLPLDWPAVPLSMANPAEGDFRNSGETDGALVNYGPSTNGLCEYTASNFDNAMKGDLLLAGYNSTGPIFRAILSSDGKVVENCPETPSSCNKTFATGFGSLPLDVVAQGDNDIFPGTVWAVTYGADNIVIFEPTDYEGAVSLCEPVYSTDVDSDNDGYSDADEMDNGTDPCSGSSQPDDYDKVLVNGFLLSNLHDSDDDEDGILDVNDSFQWDESNGFSTSVPYSNDLFNALGYGFGDIGFTGLMSNGSTDYNEQYDSDEAIFGGTAGLFTLPTTEGDAIENSQDNGFQFGINVGELTGSYLVKAKLNAPFFDNQVPSDSQSEGIYIGTGDQDNYIKLVLSSNGGVGGLTVLYESGGSIVSNPTYNVSGLLSLTELELAFLVDPVSGTVQPQYSVDKVNYIDLGPVINLSGKVLQSVQGTYTINGVASALAVGTISTSYGGNPSFAATWDYFAVTLENTDNTTITVDDIVNQTNNEGESINLAVVASGGSGNYTYSALNLPLGISVEPTNGQISGNIGTGSSTNSPYNVTITVTDNELSNVSSTTNFTWVVNSSGGSGGTDGSILTRISVGGSKVVSDPNWEKDHNNSPSAYRVSLSGDDILSSSSGQAHTGDVIMTDGSLTGLDVPLSVLERQRSGSDDGSDMLWEIPLSGGSQVKVRLYFAELYKEITSSGQRLFDVSIEGVVPSNMKDIDMYGRAGAKGAFMLDHVVTVSSDGILDIDFINTGVQNPVVNGIEILEYSGSVSSNNVPIVSNPGSQTNIEGDLISVQITATDGDDGSQSLSYVATGLPSGLSIDSSSGLISGTLSTGSSTGSPYAIEVTVTDDGTPSNVGSSVNFTWTVNNTGGGETDVWTSISNTNEHIARHENSFVQAGDKFYLLGGRESDLVEIYDYNTNTWTTGSSSPVELNHFQAVSYEGLIWAICSFEDNDYPIETPSSYIYLYNPVSNEWYQGPEIPASRRRGSAGVVVYNNKFYIVGGIQNGHTDGWVPWLDEYDPSSNTWTVLPDAPQSRDHFHSVLIGDKIYLAGGRRSGEVNSVLPTIPEVDVYDLSTGTWLSGSSLPSDLPTPRGGASSVNYQDHLLVIGGEGSGNSGIAYDLTESLDVASGEWEELDVLNQGRHGTQAIVTGGGIYITGGSPKNGGGRMQNMEAYGTNNPQGTAIIASEISTIDIYNFNGISGSTEISILNTSSNQGVFINNIQLLGENADQFLINNSYTNDILIPSGSSYDLDISYIGNNLSDSAHIILTYNTSKQKTILLKNTNTLNNVPIVSNPGSQTNIEGALISLQITATDGDDGSQSLSYVATGLPSGLSIDSSSGLISGTLSTGSSTGSPYTIEVTVTDDGTPSNVGSSINFTWVVNSSGGSGGTDGSILTRISVGGSKVVSDPNWEKDHNNSPSAYRVSLSGDDILSSSSGQAHTGDVIMTDGSLTGLDVPLSVLERQRSGSDDGSDMLWEIPLSGGSQVKVRLYFAELYKEITSSGQRLFDVSIEGVVPSNMKDIDMYGRAGAKGAFMLDHVVTVSSDGILDIDFINTGVQNPVVNGIEILEYSGSVSSNNVPIVSNPGSQTNIEGDLISVQITATDGDDGSQSLSYVATGLPSGLSIDSSSGLISGTLSTGSSTGSPYAIEVTVTDDGTPSNVESSVNFTWTVNNTGGGEVNNVPIVSNPGSQTNIEGALISLQITATDGDDGSQSLSYVATGLPSGLSIDSSSGLISGTLSTGSSTGSPYTIEVTVTDDGTPSNVGSSINFTWVVNSSGGSGGTDGSILTRISVGGSKVVSDPNWEKDHNNSPSAYRVSLSGDDILSSSSGQAHTGDVIMTDGSLTGLDVPLSVLERQRSGSDDGSDMLWEIPLSGGSQVKVRLYFAELYKEITSSGQRLFDVSIEGVVPSNMKDIDMYGRAGAKGAFMLDHVVTVSSDGILDIDFINTGVQNPVVNGIEILEYSTSSARLTSEELSLNTSNFYVFSIYPNPTEGSFEIAVENGNIEESNFEIEIFNMLGLKVFESSGISSSTINVNFDSIGMSKGMYMVKLRLGSKIQEVHKLIYR
ncbi:putative Ig domain-containing protein [Chondrinema litorale]|uniref:putative Ig domain-containing protein n=1 Tax=Chondrinema litorale TaxID=2994555 RepID=UPI002542B084|nr:putative Ig domain-containing protein [Chondrinema litorale]UZS00164.1 putative Ig domain-containing protein [Chondrinema litorale]